MSQHSRVRFNDTHTPPVVGHSGAAASQEAGPPDDLDALPEHCFSRLQKFMSMHSVGGPLFALSSPPPVHGWRPMDEKYQVMTLGQRKIYFWSCAFVDAVSHGESEDFKEPFFRLVIKPMLAVQAQALFELLGRFSSTAQVVHKIYDARERFLFLGQLPKLSPDDIHPGDIVNAEFIIVQREVEGRIVRELHVKAVYLLWTAPPSILRVRPAVSDPGPSLATVARNNAQLQVCFMLVSWPEVAMAEGRDVLDPSSGRGKAQGREHSPALSYRAGS
ncbi:hypothetical protein C8Q80DRAFT_1117418 [Daedaleopsis nitida]|nr:hypothetical protein C8Q80DRAFT_1117418 [Daedaleopsis nitida]